MTTVGEPALRRAPAPRPVAGRPPGAWGQVRALASLRLAVLRGRARRRAVRGVALLPVVAVVTVTAAALAPRGQDAFTIALLAPSAWLFFALSAVVAATTGAGGRQLITRDQSVAFLVSPAADHLGALVTAPLNIAWSVQACTLLALTAWTVGPTPGLWAPLVLTLVWIVSCTIVAQAAGWVVELVRTSWAGVWAVRLVVVAGAASVAFVALTGRVTNALDASPTSRLVSAGSSAAQGKGFGGWAVSLAVLAAASVAAWFAGVALLGTLQRRPALLQVRGETRLRRRRAPAPTALRANLRLDHAGVWRSPPLRRGIAALGIIPGAAAAASGLEWSMVALLPGLVASGAGLLFGVNAFALDGPGALWRETLPGPPRRMFAARMIVIAEVCLAGGLVALAAAALRAGVPDPAVAVAVLGAFVATTAQVVARCARWSVERPYAAALREARDQPAPPAAMAGYSAQLAASTTGTGLLYTFLAGGGPELVPTTVLLTCAFVLLAGRRLSLVARNWTDDATRTRVLATVAGARA
ncbi:MAG TPA: hypothetical protein VEV65_06725 [Kineosporiaceae bacterium]|nr:hypothetical protein [Kineosporiaceae bacterium]